MKIGFFGTPDFVLNFLDTLYKSDNKISFIVTAPDRPKGRGQIITAPSPKRFAIDRNIPFYQPEDIKDDDFIKLLKGFDTDIFVVIAYGKKLPKKILDIPKFGAFNVHFSLLPRWRGAAPVNWAILSGDTKTGVTIMKMDEGLDTGDIFLQKEVEIGFYDTTIDVFNKLIPIGVELLVRGINKLENGYVKFIKQDDSLATYARSFKKNDGLINWSKDALIIHNMVRGLQPWPGAFTKIKGKIVKIWKTDILDGKSLPGRIEDINKTSVCVGTGAGIIKILEIQEESKNRGNPVNFFTRLKLKIGDFIT